MAKWFSDNGFASSVDATRSSTCVCLAIAASAIAAKAVVIERASSNTAALIVVINKVWKEGSIIVIGSGDTVSAKLRGFAKRA